MAALWTLRSPRPLCCAGGWKHETAIPALAPSVRRRSRCLGRLSLSRARRPAAGDPGPRTIDRRRQGGLRALRLPRFRGHAGRLRRGRCARLCRRDRRRGPAGAGDQRQPLAKGGTWRDRHCRRHHGRYPQPPRAGHHDRAAILRRRRQCAGAGQRQDRQLGRPARQHRLRASGLAMEPARQAAAAARRDRVQQHPRSRSGASKRTLRRLDLRRGPPSARTGDGRVGRIQRHAADALRAALGRRHRQGGRRRPARSADGQHAGAVASRRLPAIAGTEVGPAALSLPAGCTHDLAGGRRVRRAEVPARRAGPVASGMPGGRTRHRQRHRRPVGLLAENHGGNGSRHQHPVRPDRPRRFPLWAWP